MSAQSMTNGVTTHTGTLTHAHVEQTKCLRSACICARILMNRITNTTRLLIVCAIVVLFFGEAILKNGVSSHITGPAGGYMSPYPCVPPLDFSVAATGNTRLNKCAPASALMQPCTAISNGSSHDRSARGLRPPRSCVGTHPYSTHSILMTAAAALAILTHRQYRASLASCTFLCVDLHAGDRVLGGG